MAREHEQAGHEPSLCCPCERCGENYAELLQDEAFELRLAEQEIEYESMSGYVLEDEESYA